MSSEKRLYPRKSWNGKVVFEDELGEGLVYLHARDISLGGLFLEENPPLQMGSYLLLSFVLPGKKRSLRVTGQVMRFIGEKNGGIGIRFVDLPEPVFRQLAQFLSE